MLFFHILGIILPTDELIFFRGIEPVKVLYNPKHGYINYIYTIQPVKVIITNQLIFNDFHIFSNI